MVTWPRNLMKTQSNVLDTALIDDNRNCRYGRVIDTDTGKILGPLECGEVIFYTPFAATGYFGDPEAADELIDEHGWIHTGDLGYYDNDGRLFLCGRLKTLLECQSRKFPPSDIEHCLMDHEAVEEVSVLGMPPEDIQQFPAAVVVTKSGFARDHQLAEDLKRYVAADQPSFAVAPEHAELDATPAADDSSSSEGGRRITDPESDGRLRIRSLACLLQSLVLATRDSPLSVPRPPVRPSRTGRSSITMSSGTHLRQLGPTERGANSDTFGQ
ncbi:hypothetical protein HPB49_000904 [Dermacentor silvarum]|uniref:Uncharacterized protein n=1 Tax=Dermacentor silvarum TaxID=543639 RepID=A0ACB8D990_DERSI|nr:hypothetical protein HPB49_000904 [Dermacentor silvarum]